MQIDEKLGYKYICISVYLLDFKAMIYKNEKARKRYNQKVDKNDYS